MRHGAKYVLGRDRTIRRPADEALEITLRRRRRENDKENPRRPDLPSSGSSIQTKPARQAIVRVIYKNNNNNNNSVRPYERKC